MPIQLFNKPLTGSFVPSGPLGLTADQLTLAFHLVTTGGPTAVDFYIEFTDDPTPKVPIWSREVDEQDTGNGAVTMSKVIRTFQEEGGAKLADGTHDLSCQFSRQAPFARLQIRVSAGAASALITSSSGEIPVAPPS